MSLLGVTYRDTSEGLLTEAWMIEAATSPKAHQHERKRKSSTPGAPPHNAQQALARQTGNSPASLWTRGRVSAAQRLFMAFTTLRRGLVNPVFLLLQT